VIKVRAPDRWRMGKLGVEIGWAVEIAEYGV
jgi:hypothetical protein